MKWLAALLLALVASAPAKAFEVGDKHFDRVVKIEGHINEISPFNFAYQLMEQEKKPRGDLLIIITSEGGSVEAGQAIIDSIEEIKEKTKVWCLVIDYAHSMAFNILTHCDVRLATANAQFGIHKIAGFPPHKRMTAKNLRIEAEDIDKLDRLYDIPNARAMHLGLKTYSDAADREIIWSAKRLYQLKYLHGVGTYKKAPK